MLASHIFYGDRYNIDLKKIRELYYDEYRSGEDLPNEAKDNSAMIAKYDEQFVEVGPQARLFIFRGFQGDTLWDIQVARFIDIEMCVKRIIELLEKTRTRRTCLDKDTNIQSW